MGRPTVIPPVPTEADALGFWAKVDRSGGPEACWPWLGGRSVHGWGVAHIAGQGLAAARWAWIIAMGGFDPDDAGLYVLHHCDNGLCCNPGHLFLGTQSDNMRDMDQKGRRGKVVMERVPRGEGHYRTRLKDAQVVEIRQAMAAGETHRSIAARYGVSRQYVGMLQHRRP